MSRCHWETLWTFETENLRVQWDVTHDDDLDLSWDDTGEVWENLVCGLYTAFLSRIRVYHKETEAVLGEDTLCGNIYQRVSDFRKPGQLYFHDMVREACRQARKALKRLQSVPLREAA